MKLRALIVDDEPLARTRLRRLLQFDAQIEVLADCADGRAALTAIRSQRPDVVFLDVQMPQLSGFDVLAEVGPEQMPAVVFVTAHDRFALRAFEAQALDYLLKPFDLERVRIAVERTRRFLAGGERSALWQQLSGLLQPNLRAPQTGSILVKRRERVLVLKPADIDWVEAHGDYVRLHVAGQAHLLRSTLAEMAARLEPEGFARIHRSRLVNWDRVQELTLEGEQASEVVLRTGERLAASQGYLKLLQQRFAAST
jgi:two-component system LytT family response regulator